ncbi:unnamed protein product [Orchesella dallaii]|uniref:Uncharacterized protein n=1 Tax=Orchesella dallaii TaxID=48710 RepID=A0ABP1RLX6_9HEXA
MWKTVRRWSFCEDNTQSRRRWSSSTLAIGFSLGIVHTKDLINRVTLDSGFNKDVNVIKNICSTVIFANNIFQLGK